MGLFHRATPSARFRFPLWAALPSLLACSANPNAAGPGVDPGLADAAVDAPPISNHALSFSGASQYATTGTASFPAGNTPQTISMWIRYASAANTQAFFVLHNDSGGGLKLGLRSGKLSAWTLQEGTTLVAAPTLPSVNKWHHVAYVFDGSKNILYVDGKESARSTGLQNWNFYISSWLGSTDGLYEFFAGTMDEVRFWSVARTEAQIDKEMAGKVSLNESGLLLYLDCNAAFGSRLPDKSPNGNDATLGGGDPRRMPALIPSDVPSQ
ncbi:MAG: LamG domain-containing protein [Myxococcota bacterium]|nr:LamG domain-containing protein [Myxococcota bacterium]